MHASPKYYDRTEKLSQQAVDANLFTKSRFDDYRPFDPKSVMMPKLPAKIFPKGFEARVNSTLSDSDKEFIEKLYPFDPPTESVVDEADQEVEFERLQLKLFRFKVAAAKEYSIRVAGPVDGQLILCGPDNPRLEIARAATKEPLTKQLTPGEYVLRVRYLRPVPATAVYQIGFKGR